MVASQQSTTRSYRWSEEDSEMVWSHCRMWVGALDVIKLWPPHWPYWRRVGMEALVFSQEQEYLRKK